MDNLYIRILNATRRCIYTPEQVDRLFTGGESDLNGEDRATCALDGGGAGMPRSGREIGVVQIRSHHSVQLSSDEQFAEAA